MYTVKLARQVDVIATVEIDAESVGEAEAEALERHDSDDVGEWSISWESATDAEVFDVELMDECQCDIPEPNENDFCGRCDLQIAE